MESTLGPEKAGEKNFARVAAGQIELGGIVPIGYARDMINFSSAFDSAWERMMVILFRPFDLGKWFLIGFSAFLAGLSSGGNGFNFNPGFPTGNTSSLANTSSNSNWHFNYYGNNNLHSYSSNLSNSLNGLQAGAIFLVVGIFVVFILLVVVAMYWLGSRGQFMLLDNLVRNRGAVSWPWAHYARQANSLFFMHLIFLGIGVAILIPFGLVGFFMTWPHLQNHSWPGGAEIGGFLLLGLAYLIVVVFFSVIFFIFREFGVPIMFRDGILAPAAFWESMKLAQLHAASIAVFLLLRIALFIAVAIVAVILVCGTCCLGALPYLGTVILLPTVVYVRCFTLDCLAQFGPQYNVWTVDVPATEASITPLPPLG